MYAFWNRTPRYVVKACQALHVKVILMLPADSYGFRLRRRASCADGIATRNSFILPYGSQGSHLRAAWDVECGHGT